MIADPGARALFRLPIASGPSKPSVVELSGSTPISDNTLITGLDDGEVLIADRESGLLAQLSDLETSSAKYRAMQSRPSSASSLPVPWNQQPERPETLRRRGYPGITSPRAMDAYAGILYVLNGPANDLFLCAFHDARAIRAPKREFSVTRIVATQDWLFGIDRASGRLIRSPRLVPSELTLLPGAQYQSLLPVLEYLKRHKLLATRAVEVSGTIEQTLARERMAWPARGTVAEPYDRRKNVASFCLLNPNMCKDGLPVEQPPGSTILLAELYAERYTSATRVTLDGSATLGEVVDRLIESEEFHQRRSEEFLRQMNGVKADDPRVLRAQREGVFRISQEQVRYVIPIEVTELRPGSEFNDLVGSVYSTIRIAPLQRVASSKAGIVSGVDHPDDANCTDARAAMKELLTAINFAAAVSTRTVFVGVAEDRFDAAHRDFKAPADPAVSALYAVNHGPDLTPAPPPADGAVPPGVEPMTYRAYRDEDHGTAIASIIAGRTRGVPGGRRPERRADCDARGHRRPDRPWHRHRARARQLDDVGDQHEPDLEADRGLEAAHGDGGQPDHGALRGRRAELERPGHAVHWQRRAVPGLPRGDPGQRAGRRRHDPEGRRHLCGLAHRQGRAPLCAGRRLLRRRPGKRLRQGAGHVVCHRARVGRPPQCCRPWTTPSRRRKSNSG